MSRLERLALPVGLAALLALAALAVWWSGRLPDGPVDPDWDHTRCARCGMLLSEPSFAAQVQWDDGRVVHYDDPGCLLVDAWNAPGGLDAAHAVWFHHRSEPRWIALADVGFEPVEHTPMDFGLAAVERVEHDGALDPERAREIALERAGSQP